MLPSRAPLSASFVQPTLIQIKEKLLAIHVMLTNTQVMFGGAGYGGAVGYLYTHRRKQEAHPVGLFLKTWVFIDAFLFAFLFWVGEGILR